MKKYLLIMVAALSVAGANAQNLPAQKVNAASDFKKATTSEVSTSQRVEMQNLAQYRHNLRTVAPVNATKAVNGPRKSYASGVYYNRPAGSMYQHFSAEGSGYYPTILRFPAYTYVAFVDESADPSSSTWMLSTSDITEYAEDGTYNWSQQPLADGYLYPILTLENGSDSYQLSEDGRYYQQGYITRMSSTIEVTPMGFNDDHAAECNYYGWSGSNKNHYLFGTGEMDDEDEDGNYTGTYKFYGVSTDFEAPVSPLYVESIDIPCFTFSSENGIPAGKELTLSIIDKESNETVATMTCTSDDFSYLEYNGDYYSYDTDYGALYDCNLHFSCKGVDAFGTEVEEPVVISDAFTVVVTGFEQDGVDVGFGAYKNYDPDVTEPTYNLVYNEADENDSYGWRYQTPFNIGITFNGLFDVVYNYGDVEATDGETYPSYYVKVADDGTSCSNGIFTDLDGALVFTGTAWFTEDGDEMYSAELPEWIQGMSATVYGEEEESLTPSEYTIGFTADALPADVTGRGAFIYIEGRGAVIDTPIFVYQGDPETAWNMAVEAAGIEYVTTKPMTVNNGKTYNVAGQIVGENYKGIVIKNGKKMLNK